jgi:hypothetical protein
MLMNVDYVHGDIRLNVDVDVLHYQYYIEILIMNNVLHRLHRVSVLFFLDDYNHNFL